MTHHAKPKCARCKRVAREGHTCKRPKALKRTALVARKAAPVRGERPPAKNFKRASREHVRAYGVDGRAAWVKKRLCVAWKKVGHMCKGPIVNCHTKGGGTSRKGDADTIIAGCQGLHDEMHRGQQSCAERLGLDFEALAAQCEADWQAHCLGEFPYGPEMWASQQ